MCGIAGLVGPGVGDDHLAVAEAMLASIVHRGPDESAVRRLGPAVLGTCRLALVDGPTSRQPMAAPSGRHLLSFNGEIFNYRELREQLEAEGVRFTTRGDTEVLLHAVTRWGLAALPRLRGQFALALWDAETETLLLARDRFGIVPLFYTDAGSGRHAFASEVKALAAAGIRTPLSLPDVVDAGVLWGLHPGRSVFSGVATVPPGSWVRLDRDGVTSGAYWELRYAEDRDDRPIDEQAADLADLLSRAVARRIPEEGEPAVLVSGGLDSSAVLSLLRDHVPDGPLRSFSIEFDSPALDESGFQSLATKMFDTDHEAVRVDDESVARALLQMVQHAEVPLVRTAPAATVQLAAAVEARGTRCVLSGEGADELFCGYDLFKVAGIRDAWAADPTSPTWPARLEEALAQQRALGRSVERAFYEQGLDQRDDLVFSHQSRWRASYRITQYLRPELRAHLGLEDVLDGVRTRVPEVYRGWSAVEQAQYLEATYFLPTTLLGSQADRPFMAHSIEGRYPFLDEDVADFALTLPQANKLDGVNEKAVLKLAMREAVPPEIRDRVKQPYTAPEGDVFRSAPGRALAATFLSPTALSGTGLFDPARVGWLVDKVHRRRTSFYDDLALLWLVSTQILAETYGTTL